jgi:hypothetical protein
MRMRTINLVDPPFIARVAAGAPGYVETFDYPSWSGTIANPLYFVGFVFDADWVEDFEYPWAGTIANPDYYLTLTFDADWVEDFETGW